MNFFARRAARSGRQARPASASDPDRILQPVAQRIVVTALEPALLALAFARDDQVLQAARPPRRRLAALGAAPIPLHPQLVLPLPRYVQLREFVLDACSHISKWPIDFVPGIARPAAQPANTTHPSQVTLAPAIVPATILPSWFP
jgi:hypothetical protein